MTAHALTGSDRLGGYTGCQWAGALCGCLLQQGARSMTRERIDSQNRNRSHGECYRRRSAPCVDRTAMSMTELSGSGSRRSPHDPRRRPPRRPHHRRHHRHPHRPRRVATMTPYYADDAVTLYHGDCLQITEWLEADVLVTDPPYEIAGGRIGKHEGGVRPVHADAAWDLIAVRDDALTLWGDRPRMVFGSPKMQHLAPEYRGTPLIWDKGDDPGMGDHAWPFGTNYELIWVRGDGWSGKRRSSIFRAPRKTSDARSIGHPTPKPTGLMETLVSYAPQGIVADPFAGAGSTLIAAKNLGRRAIGVEIDERYCEIVANRLSQDVLDFGEPA